MVPPLPEDAAVAPVNLMLHSMFSQVDISLNEKLVTPSKIPTPIVLIWKLCSLMDKKPRQVS